MKLDLRCKLENLDGTPTETMMATLLANELVSCADGPAFQFYDWAKELVSTGQLEIDSSAIHGLTDWILSSKTMTILAKVQIVRSIQKQHQQDALDSAGLLLSVRQ